MNPSIHCCHAPLSPSPGSFCYPPGDSKGLPSPGHGAQASLIPVGGGVVVLPTPVRHQRSLGLAPGMWGNQALCLVLRNAFAVSFKAPLSRTPWKHSLLRIIFPFDFSVSVVRTTECCLWGWGGAALADVAVAAGSCFGEPGLQAGAVLEAPSSPRSHIPASYPSSPALDPVGEVPVRSESGRRTLLPSLRSQLLSESTQ